MRLWDLEQDMLDLQGETLELTIKDIYFVTSLSHRGALVKLSGTRHWGDPLGIQYYVNTYFLPGTQKLGMKIPISQITSFPLKFLVTMIDRVAGTSTLHLETQNHIRIVVECLQSVVFD